MFSSCFLLCGIGLQEKIIFCAKKWVQREWLINNFQY
jgi:hypothetical protein